MKRSFSILALVLLLAAPARAVDLGYAVGGGVVIPVPERLTELATVGPHADVAIAYKLMTWLSVALNLSLDFPIAEELPNGHTPEARFIGINARSMFHGGDFFKYWGSVGLGLYFNALSTCDERGVCAEDFRSKLGMDLSAGVGFRVYDELSMGPAVGITFPSVSDISDVWFVHTSLRFHWNL